MELNQLRYFLVVARVQSITRAAAELYITQSALSRVIMRLENELGTPLFDRRAGRITLNDKGEVFLEHVTLGLKELDLAVSAVSTAAGTQTFTMFNYLATSIFQTITSRCQATFPSLEFQYHNYEVTDEADPIRKFAPDVVMSPVGELKGYTIFRQYTEQWCVLMNERYQLSAPGPTGTITLEQLAREPIAFYGSPYDKAFVTDLFSSHGLTARIHAAENTAESGALINRCRAVGIAPVNNYRYIISSINQMPIRAMFLTDAVCQRPVYFLKRARFPASDEARAALDYVVACLDEDNQQVEAFIRERF